MLGLITERYEALCDIVDEQARISFDVIPQKRLDFEYFPLFFPKPSKSKNQKNNNIQYKLLTFIAIYTALQLAYDRDNVTNIDLGSGDSLPLSVLGCIGLTSIGIELPRDFFFQFALKTTYGHKIEDLDSNTPQDVFETRLETQEYQHFMQRFMPLIRNHEPEIDRAEEVLSLFQNSGLIKGDNIQVYGNAFDPDCYEEIYGNLEIDSLFLFESSGGIRKATNLMRDYILHKNPEALLVLYSPRPLERYQQSGPYESNFDGLETKQLGHRFYVVYHQQNTIISSFLDHLSGMNFQSDDWILERVDSLET